jgi:hypothetical protein
MGSDPRRARELGRRGEEVAAGFLTRRGYRVVGSGFLARRGEVDLVCRRGDRLVLVEVKTRSSLNAAAAEYRALAGWRGPIDFAVVAITEGREPELIEDPF